MKDKLYFSLTGGFPQRDGYTINLFDGQDVDNRNHLVRPLEMLWTPTDRLDIRLMVNGERDRDGDFPIYDLASHPRQPAADRPRLHRRSRPHHRPGRDHATYHGDSVEITSVSAYQQWHSHEVTDLDETRFDLLRRQNNASEHNLIQELRLSSPTDKPLVLNKDASSSGWSACSHFGRIRTRTSATKRGPLASQLRRTFAFTSFTDSNILNYGVGVFGDATLTLWDKLDLTAGAALRLRAQPRRHRLASTAPAISAPRDQRGTQEFDQVSPRFETGYHWTKDMLHLRQRAKGYKSRRIQHHAADEQVLLRPREQLDYELGGKSVGSTTA